MSLLAKTVQMDNEEAIDAVLHCFQNAGLSNALDNEVVGGRAAQTLAQISSRGNERVLAALVARIGEIAVPGARVSLGDDLAVCFVGTLWVTNLKVTSVIPLKVDKRTWHQVALEDDIASWKEAQERIAKCMMLDAYRALQL